MTIVLLFALIYSNYAQEKRMYRIQDTSIDFRANEIKNEINRQDEIQTEISSIIAMKRYDIIEIMEIKNEFHETLNNYYDDLYELNCMNSESIETSQITILLNLFKKSIKGTFELLILFMNNASIYFEESEEYQLARLMNYFILNLSYTDI